MKKNPAAFFYLLFLIKIKHSLSFLIHDKNLAKTMFVLQVKSTDTNVSSYCRVTMFSFYNVLAQHQKDAGNTDFPKKYPYSYFRHTWYSFLSRLDINYQPGFICNDPDCGLQPKTVLFDGTSLSFQKQFHYDLSSLTDWKQERLKGR